MAPNSQSKKEMACASPDETDLSLSAEKSVESPMKGSYSFSSNGSMDGERGEASDEHKSAELPAQFHTQTRRKAEHVIDEPANPTCTVQDSFLLLCC